MPPPLAETRIDKSPDFYTLGTANVLTHGTFYGVANCFIFFKYVLTVPTTLTVGHIHKWIETDHILGDRCTVELKGLSATEGASLNPRTITGNRSLAFMRHPGSGNSGRENAMAKFSVIHWKPMTAKTRKCWPARREGGRSLGGKKAGNIIYQTRLVRDCKSQLAWPLSWGQLWRTAMT